MNGNLARRLYELQQLDLELEAKGKALQLLAGQLGETAELIALRADLAREQKTVEDLKKQQRDAEWEIDDLSAKIAGAEDKLYGGKLRNPKELTGLQNEAAAWKKQRSAVEDRILDTMGRVETTNSRISGLKEQLGRTETEWRRRQAELTTAIEQLKAQIAGLEAHRKLEADSIDRQAIDIYATLRRQQGTAVARVEQGMCRGCRISLPITDLQRARSGGLVQCSSCGRILFLA